MPEIDHFWTFVGAVLVLLAIPGPGTFCLLNSTARQGVRGGYAALCGLLLGDQLLLWTAVAGVAAILKAHAAALVVLQYAGCAYLAWLGMRLLLARAGAAGAPVGFPRHADFVRGFLVTITNPKAVIFYMAFFPLFVNPQQAHRGATFFAMAVTIAVLSAAYCSLLVLAGARLAARWSRHPRLALWSQRSVGAVLLGFAVRLTSRA